MPETAKRDCHRHWHCWERDRTGRIRFQELFVIYKLISSFQEKKDCSGNSFPEKRKYISMRPKGRATPVEMEENYPEEDKMSIKVPRSSCDMIEWLLLNKKHKVQNQWSPILTKEERMSSKTLLYRSSTQQQPMEWVIWGFFLPLIAYMPS